MDGNTVNEDTETNTDVAAVRMMARYVSMLQDMGISYFIPEDGNTASSHEALRELENIKNDLENTSELDELSVDALNNLDYVCLRLQTAVGNDVIEKDTPNFSIVNVSHLVREARNRVRGPIRSPDDPKVEGVDEMNAYRNGGMREVKHVRGTRNFLQYDKKIIERMNG